MGWVGWPIHRTGWLALAYRSADMNSLSWENYMPLARATLYADGVDSYLAPTWDNSDTWVPTLRHIARSGGKIAR